MNIIDKFFTFRGAAKMGACLALLKAGYVLTDGLVFGSIKGVLNAAHNIKLEDEKAEWYKATEERKNNDEENK